MAEPPNILVFLTDDHGQWAANCYGNSEIHSPAMDYIAATGARMERAFTPCPVCSPARASFFTGKIPSAHGVHDHIAEAAAGRDHPGIGEQTIIAQRLQKAGYYTGLTGKWHLNHFRERYRGFDEWFTLGKGTNAQFREQTYYEDERLISKYGNQAVHLTERALQFINSPRRDTGKPFFLFAGYTNTHRPHTGEPERLVSHYRKCSFRDIPDEEHLPSRGWERRRLPKDKEELREEQAQYYSAVNLIDEQVGRILDELHNRGELENTLIVYTADHGHMNGHHGLSGKGNATVPQNFLDESILVPCLVSWPGHIKAGQVCSAPVDHCDLHATLLEVAGYSENDTERTMMPGKSYLPMLKTGDWSGWRDAQFCEYGNARMIRTAKAKLVRRYPGPNGHFGDEFYDLESDPRENANRIDDASCASVIDVLDKRLTAYFERHGTAEFSGTQIAEQPICNNGQPWSVTREFLEGRYNKA